MDMIVDAPARTTYTVRFPDRHPAPGLLNGVGMYHGTLMETLDDWSTVALMNRWPWLEIYQGGNLLIRRLFTERN